MYGQRIGAGVRRIRDSQFVRDTLLLQSGQLVLIVAQAAANFFVIRALLPDAFGAYTLIQTVAAFAGILDVTGSTRLSATQLAQAIGADNQNDVLDVLAYFLRINLTYNGPLIALFLLIAPLLTNLAYHDPRVTMWCGWLAIVELTDLPTQLVGMCFQASGQIRRLVNYESSRTLLTSVIIIIVMVLNQGIAALVLSTIFVSVLYGLISIVRYDRLSRRDNRFPTWQVLFDRVRTVPIWPRFRLGFAIAIDKNLGGLLDKALLLFIASLGVTVLADYQVAYKVVTLPQPLISGLSRNLDVFIPRQLGALAAAEGNAATRRTFIQATVVSGALWTLPTLGLALAAPIAIFVAFPHYFGGISYVFPLLLQSIGIGLGVSIGPTLRTLKHIRYSIISQTLMIVSIVPVGTLLIRLFGPPGVSWLSGVIELAQVIGLSLVILWLTRPSYARVTPASR